MRRNDIEKVIYIFDLGSVYVVSRAGDKCCLCLLGNGFYEDFRRRMTIYLEYEWDFTHKSKIEVTGYLFCDSKRIVDIGDMNMESILKLIQKP